MTSKWQSLSVLANHKALYPRYPWNECSQSDTGFREVLHNCSIDLCGKILRNLKMALNNIKKDFGKNLYGIWSPGNRFLWQVFSAKSTLASFTWFLLLPVFFNAWGRKKSIKSHRIGKIVARTHEVNEVKCFYVFPSLLEKKARKREDKRPDRRFHLPPETIT